MLVNCQRLMAKPDRSGTQYGKMELETTCRWPLFLAHGAETIAGSTLRDCGSVIRIFGV